MNDPFEKKVRAAAVAGWWVVLIGYALLIATWAVYLGLMSDRPVWLLSTTALNSALFFRPEFPKLWAYQGLGRIRHGRRSNSRIAASVAPLFASV